MNAVLTIAISAMTATVFASTAGAQEKEPGRVTRQPIENDSIVGSGDFDGDRKTDLLWHNQSTGALQIWHMDGHRIIGRAIVRGEGGTAASIGLPWRVAGVNDFNGDGRSDLLWHNASTGETQVWQMSGSQSKGRATVLGENHEAAAVGLPWAIVGASDFNRDGSTDILWHNRATGETQIWQMNAHKVTGRTTVLGENGTAALVGSPWSIVGSGDMNSDGNADIVWHNSSTGETQVWHLDRHRVTARATVLSENNSASRVGLPWRIVGIARLEGNPTPDIVWYNGSTRETQIWQMDGYRLTSRATVQLTAANSFTDAAASAMAPRGSPIATKDQEFGTGGATGRATEAFLPENSIRVRVWYPIAFGYKGDTGAFGYVGPTSCDAFSISVAAGTEAARERNPIRVASDARMEAAADHYSCSYILSDIPFGQTVRVGVRVGRDDLSGPWQGGSLSQPPSGQQRAIVQSSVTETLSASRPRATLSFEMAYVPATSR